MSEKGFEDDFGGEEIKDDSMRRSRSEEVAEGRVQEFEGFHLGQKVMVQGMGGEYVIKAFNIAAREVHLGVSMEDNDDDFPVGIDRLVKK